MNTLNRLLLLFLFICYISEASNCVWKTWAGSYDYTYDLTPLILHGVDYHFHSNTTNRTDDYYLNFCDYTTVKCKGKPGALILNRNESFNEENDPLCFILGYPLLHQDFEFIDKDDPNKGLKIVYKNGDHKICKLLDQSPLIEVELSCIEPENDFDDVHFDEVIQVGDPIKDCHYIAKLRSSVGACPSRLFRSNFSVGSVFLILFFVMVAAYFTIGFIYNYNVKGQQFGMESCPQRRFWFTLLPSLVYEGILYTYYNISYLVCNDTNNPYFHNSQYENVASSSEYDKRPTYIPQ